ncbi:DNA damage-regulated autophagy modulator protein 1-like [Rhinoderma darwinii]|uniref:DNA damage-regulated autophagy modulator protein 1-like n=1 Tax=Rhinoderma darwinii TaxID=43563 RepID=UPI003F672C9F
MEIRGLAFLPLLWFVWMLLGLGTLTVLTVMSGHEKYPYISGTGKMFPESVIYTVVFMVMSILGAGVASIQYRFMIIQSEPSEKRYIIGQRILYAMACIGCIGNVMNAIYSAKENPTVHGIGAGLAFFLAATYNLCQALCLYKRSFSSRGMCHIRLVTTGVTIVALLISIIPYAAAISGSFSNRCGSRCIEILNITGMLGEYMGFSGLAIHQVTHYTDFQSLSLTLSREGVSISMREKTQDPENPE